MIHNQETSICILLDIDVDFLRKHKVEKIGLINIYKVGNIFYCASKTAKLPKKYEWKHIKNVFIEKYGWKCFKCVL